MPTASTLPGSAHTVPNSPMSASAVLLRLVLTVLRIPLLGRKAHIEDEQLTAEQIRSRYDQNPLTPSLNASLRLVGRCLSQTATGAQLDEVAAYHLLLREPRSTGDLQHDCIVADAITLMEGLLPELEFTRSA